jgi:hypothetical protein
VADAPDPIPSLDPEGDRLRAQEEARRAEAQRKHAEEQARRAREREADAHHDARVAAATPGYVKVMKWAGLGVAVAGGIGIAATYLRYDKDDITRSEFEDQRLANDISWIVFGAGAGAFVTSFILVPHVPREEPAPAQELQVSFGLAPGGLWLGVRH